MVPTRIGYRHHSLAPEIMLNAVSLYIAESGQRLHTLIALYTKAITSQLYSLPDLNQTCDMILRHLQKQPYQTNLAFTGKELNVLDLGENALTPSPPT